MDYGTHKLLESVTHKTLHANSFSRSSSQASLLLTDLLSRYLTLLSSTCAKYAHHAGRTRLSPRDALSAFDELGVSTKELEEYCSLEGRELARYAYHSARRLEDLNELKAQIYDGIRQDRGDAFPLYYGQIPSSVLEDEEVESDEDLQENNAPLPRTLSHLLDDMDVDIVGEPSRKDFAGPGKSTTPPLPLSPISNPSTPTRKRPRVSGWSAPDHIPDFLPPFPTTQPSSDPHPQEEPTAQIPPQKIEKPTSSVVQPLTSTSTSSDYLTQIPYSQSSLSAEPSWHLPTPPPTFDATVPSKTPRLPTPQTQPSLLSAYHHILTHPPPPSTSLSNHARHKVAMGLLDQVQNTPRWEPPDTMFSSVAPCSPRVAIIGPSYPVPLGKTPLIGDGKTEIDTRLPSVPPRPVSTNERLTPLIGQQSSRLPDLARHVLPSSVHTRTTRLTHPPPLSRPVNGIPQKLFYGEGTPAPWNSNSSPSAVPPTPVMGKDPAPNGIGKFKDPGRPLQDATLFATWEHDTKDFRELLRRGTKGGSTGGSTNTGLTLSLGTPRLRSGSKA